MSNASSTFNAAPVSVVGSALWALAGDALGWITELADESEVKRRTGERKVSRPVEWRRKIGGWSGVEVLLPAGTYSDDTQLRLAVSRAILGDGSFDVEAFAKVELPVWSSYSLGAGLGSKAAASNLTKKGVNWFSNYYDVKGLKYLNGGGNGAAMRIQPHVWASSAARFDKMLLDVLRDSLVTHGHPHGFCGALFHAVALSDVLTEGFVGSPEAWVRYLNVFDEIHERITADNQLKDFWLPTWEKESGRSLVAAMKEAKRDARRDIDSIVRVVERLEGGGAYIGAIEAIDGFNKKFRGSGLKTAMLASTLSWLYRDASVEEAMIVASNVLGSDTDTIATMGGALLGALSPAPSWSLQDREYVIEEAVRLERIREGQVGRGFSYPDLMQWRPPARQSAAVVQAGADIAVVGLGRAEALGGEYAAGEDVWQWLRLSFGQTVLAKRKADLKQAVATQLPDSGATKRKPTKEDLALQRNVERRKPDKTDGNSLSLPLGVSSDRSQSMGKFSSGQEAASGKETDVRDLVDVLSDKVIASNFDDRELGRALNECIEKRESVEAAVALAAIVAKAKLSRQRRSRG